MGGLLGAMVSSRPMQLPKDMSGSTLLSQPGSVLTSKIHVATKGHPILGVWASPVAMLMSGGCIATGAMLI